MSKNKLTIAALKEARAKLNQLNDGRKLINDEDACQFIQERGFALLMPIAGIPLPNLSEADAEPPWKGFDITDRAWAWKETLPGQKYCAYTKLISGRGTFIDWRLYPSFLKVYGPDGDPEYEYENGRLDRSELDLYRLVEKAGPIDSRELWRQAKTLFNGKRTRFTATLAKLQARFYLTVSGGSLEGWTLHTWDLVERQVPPDVLVSLPIIDDARKKILLQTIRNCVAVSERKLRSILHWTLAELNRSILSLRQEGMISEVIVEGENQPWLMIKEAKT